MRFKKSKFSFVYSPMHNTSRIPINDPDYPIGLPEDSSPTANTTILSDLTPDEYGLNFKWSFDFGDVSLSHLSMYDRNFNLTGINLYTNAGGNVLNAVPFYSYRLTDISNIVTVLLFMTTLGLVNAATNQSWSKDELINDLDRVEHELLLLNSKIGKLQSIERIEEESKKLNLVKIAKIYHITDNEDKVALR